MIRSVASADIVTILIRWKQPTLRLPKMCDAVDDKKRSFGGCCNNGLNPLEAAQTLHQSRRLVLSLLNPMAMPNTYHQIYLQFVFAVKYRNAVISKSWRFTLFGVIGNLINETNCKTIIVNGVDDHVHCFVGLKPVVSVSELMKTVKAKSSKYINDQQLTQERFEWQEGYGVFSYSQSQVDSVYKYIQNQEAHHQKQTFRDEYLAFLKKFAIAYDEQYLFQELM